MHAAKDTYDGGLCDATLGEPLRKSDRRQGVKAISRSELGALLAHDRALRRRGREDPGLAAVLRRLQRFQTRRLLKTYADFRAEPRYRGAVSFFLRDLHAPREAELRVQQLSRARGILERTMPPRALATIGLSTELEILIQELDHAMAARLPGEAAVTASGYADAYRRVGQRTDRERQIELVLRIGRELERMVKHRAFQTLLRLAHGPAHLAGFAHLQTFLERGFDAFRRMGSAAELLAAIEERETTTVQRLFAASPRPFDVGADG